MLKSPFQHNLTAKRFSNELTNKLLKPFLLAWPVQAKIADSRIRFVKRVILFLFFMQFLQGRSARLTNKGGFFLFWMYFYECWSSICWWENYSIPVLITTRVWAGNGEWGQPQHCSGRHIQTLQVKSWPRDFNNNTTKLRASCYNCKKIFRKTPKKLENENYEVEFCEDIK